MASTCRVWRSAKTSVQFLPHASFLFTGYRLAADQGFYSAIVPQHSAIPAVVQCWALFACCTFLCPLSRTAWHDARCLSAATLCCWYGTLLAVQLTAFRSWTWHDAHCAASTVHCWTLCLLQALAWTLGLPLLHAAAAWAVSACCKASSLVGVCWVM